MATPEVKPEEQLNSLDARMLAEEAARSTTAPAPEATPAPAEPAKVESAPAPEKPPVEPVAAPPAAPVQPVSPAPEPPSEPVEVKPPEKDKQVPLSVHLHTKHKFQKRLQSEQERRIAAERRAEELAQHQGQEADPLTTWQADPEHEGLAIPKEVLQQHDAFVRAGAQREAAAAPPQPFDDAAKMRVTAALNAMPKAARWAVDYADGRNWITAEEAREIAAAPDPAAKAFEIARDHFDTFGEPDEVALFNQLFPPQAEPARPTPPAAPPRPAAPPATAPQPAAPPRAPATPAPKPEETTNANAEPEYEPPGTTAHMRRLAAMFGKS